MTENKNPQPKFKFGDKVQVTNTKGITFLVTNINWSEWGEKFTYRAKGHNSEFYESDLTLVVEPLSAEFECEWAFNKHCGYFPFVVGTGHTPKELESFAGKRTKVVVTEVEVDVKHAIAYQKNDFAIWGPVRENYFRAGSREENNRLKPTLDAMINCVEALEKAKKRSSYSWSGGSEYNYSDYKNEGAIEIATQALAELEKVVGDE